LPRIIDLDLIAPEGVTIRKSGVEYRLPGDPPTALWLSIIAAHDAHIAAAGAEHFQTLQVFHDRMLLLFKLEQPKLTALPFGPAGMISILIGFYGAPDDEAPEDPPGADEAASAKRTTTGRRASPAKPKTATRSRSSR